MRPGHILTLANRSKKKPLLTAASVALSFGVLLGSAPVSAETVFTTTAGTMVEKGIVSPDDGYTGYFEKIVFHFFDDNLNSSNPSAPYFASMDCTGGYCILKTNIDLYNPSVFNSDTDWETFGAGSGIISHNYLISRTRNVYHEGGLVLTERFSNDLWDFHDNISYWPSDLASGMGIFDFEQSFIYFTSDYGHEGRFSLAEFVSAAEGLNCINYCASQSYFLDTSNDSFILWMSLGGDYVAPNPGLRITGVTLAYNLPAIPEPETYAMLLAGLGVVGAAARRRRIKERN